MATGCATFTDSTRACLFRAAAENSSYGMCHTGASLTGLTAATHNGGTNTHALTNQSPVPF